VTENHVFRARVITFSRDALYYTILSGSPEDVVLIGMPVAVSMYLNVKKVVPSVLDTACWPFLFYGLVQIEKTVKGKAKRQPCSAGTDMEWLKYCIVVDQDVDIYQSADVYVGHRHSMLAGTRHHYDSGNPSFSRDPHRCTGQGHF